MHNLCINQNHLLFSKKFSILLSILFLNLDKIFSDGYSFQIEVTYKLWKKKFRIKEIPIVFVDRIYGESKMSGKIISEALFLLLKIRFGK